MTVINYTPPPTSRDFMKSDAFFRIIAGPIGSGKSVTCCMEIARRCAMQKPGRDGLRRSRWLVVRNTAPQLKDTTIKTWFQWFPPGVAGTWKESEKLFILRFGDVHAEILFRPLDTPDDAARVLSLEISGCWANESRELDRSIIEAIHGRLGRYPSAAEGGCTWNGMIADTNMPEEDSYWMRAMEGIPLDDDDPKSVVPCESFIQPSALLDDDTLSPDAENIENLPPDYYTRLVQGRSKDWVNVHLRCHYGLNQSGKPVYLRHFKKERHIAPRPLKVNPQLPLVIGMDFGRTPAALIFQMQSPERISALNEIVSFDMGIRTFITRKLTPVLKMNYPTNPVVIIGDPSGMNGNQVGESNCFRELKNAGYKAIPAKTNNPDVRIGALESLMTQYPDGDPMLLIDPKCRWFIQAIRSKYRYKKQQNGNFADRPEKNAWSHIAEAAQYGAMFLLNGYDPADYIIIDYDPIRGMRPRYTPADSYTGY